MNFTKRAIEIIENDSKQDTFSGAICIVENNEVAAEGYGFANRSEKINNTATTRFGMASGCKVFTAVAICQLAEQGRLSFETRLKDCLSITFPHFDPEITIHHLLTHSSGIPDYFDEEVMDDFEQLWETVPMYRIQEPKDFLPLFQHGEMKFRPGEKFSYSNAGYILLGLIVEQVSGRSFTTYVENNIFRRCGMNDSGYFRMDQLPERTAFGYIEQGESWRTNIYSLPVQGGPDGGAFTTVLDMKTFWDALFSNQLLSPQNTDKLLSPLIQVNERTYYGYGVWMLGFEGRIRKHFVMGSDPGVSLQSSVYKDRKLQVHLIGNVGGRAHSLSRVLDEMLFSESD
ncbi:serine hydrolase domain-containing protein [Marinicrinis lubricantis]|uniref:Serine hydrolase domain-containing protein n=1 Tax=Marinicrinis lubricantis TaxID=2086470 RepID=A0ABW1IRU6_9BACL